MLGARLASLCKEEKLTLTDAIDRIQKGQLKLSHGHQIKTRLIELDTQLGKLAPLRGSELLDALFPDTEPDLKQLRDILVEGICPDATASQLLERLRTNVTQHELPTDIDCVRVMSLHKSKGLTADIVIILGCIEGLLPDLSDANTDEEIHNAIDEGRRLFYVALTRARKCLIVSSVTWLPTRLARDMNISYDNGNKGYFETITTKYIHELGPTCTDPICGQKLLEEFQYCSGIANSSH